MGQALAIASIASTVVGTIGQARGQSQAAKAQAQDATFRAAIARNNQIIAKQKADSARQVGEQDARNQEARTRQLIGKQRAALAANGVVVDIDSAGDITAETAELGAVDALTIRRNAEAKALAAESQATQFTSEAQLLDQTAESTVRAGRTEATGTVLSGFGSVASKWYTFKDQGVFG